VDAVSDLYAHAVVVADAIHDSHADAVPAAALHPHAVPSS
jgi:hypothetical protein